MKLEVEKSSPKSPKMAMLVGSEKPAVMPINAGQFPKSLASQRVWVGWRWEKVKGRWSKPPYSMEKSRKANVTLAEDWSTLNSILSAVKNGELDGVGIVLEAAGLLGVDLDDCRDPASGEIQPWAMEIVTLLNSYSEISPSGTGIKILVKAVKPGPQCRRDHVEIYDRSRYFTLTGHRLPDTPEEPEPRQTELDAVYKKWLAPAKTQVAEPRALDDDSLLKIAFQAKNGDRIRKLWNGDRSAYSSDSEADLALCTLLAFYFPDTNHLDAVFRRSGLYRAKWDRDDYRLSTLHKAIGSQTECYQPRQSSSPLSAIPKDRSASEKPVPKSLEWNGPPLPLPTLSAVPPFPIELLPEPVAEYWTLAAKSIHVPVDYVAVPGLALLGAAIGRSRSAAIKRTYSKPPLLWCVLIAPPSAGKSPALNLAAAPLWKSEERWRKAFQGEQSSYELEADLYKVTYEKWRKSGCKGEPPEKPTQPTLRQAILDDATVEAAIRVLRDNPRGIIVAKDELSAFVLGLNQYKGGKGSDRQFWLSAWAGAAIKVNRSGDKEAPPLSVPQPFAAVAGALCPEVLPTLRGDVRPGDAPADGFIDRFLMSYPDPLEAVGETWEEIPEAVEQRYCEIVLRLLGLDLMPAHEGQTSRQSHHIAFDIEAKQVWQDFTDGIATRQNAREVDDPFRATLGKLREYGLRLAGLLWCVKQASGAGMVIGKIDAETMRDAWKLIDYFEAHARRCHGLGVSDRVGRVARRIRDWLLQSDRPAFIRSQLFQQLKDKRDVKNSEALNDSLNMLCDHGYLKLTEGDGSGRPGPTPQTYAVNPLWDRKQRAELNSGDFGDGFPLLNPSKEGA
ncbi:MAG: DUF3987 domain-containing protein [Fimbriiglobus sp.]